MAILPASASDDVDHVALLTALGSLKRGDFSVRLPMSWTGLAGKVADAFNDMVEMNERLASELERLSRVVGTEGKITQNLGGSEDTAQMARRSVRRQLQSLTRLIDDLVDVARITTGKITMTRAPVNLKDSALRAIDALASAGKSGEHRIELDGRDTWILADSVR